MKITLNKQDEEKFYNYLDTKEKNIYVADRVNEFIGFDYKYLKPANLKNNNEELIDLLSDDEEDYELFSEYFDGKLRCLDINKYLNNPYFKNIIIDNIIDKHYQLKYESYKPYEVFICDEINVLDNKYYKEETRLAYFDKPLKFISLYQDKERWMLIVPSEIDTMEEELKEVNGNVVVFGLGLGYFQYIASLKKEVKKITIVELDEKIINLFKKHILPQFEYKDKIEIIHANAYDFIDHMMKKDQYDYAYVDLWHNAFDGIEFYTAFKKVEDKFSTTTFRYWLEPSMICLLRRCMLSLLVEQYEGLEEENYTHADNYLDELINKMYFMFKDKNITKISEIEELISHDFLKNLAKSL